MELAGITKNNELVRQEEWNNRVDSLKAKVKKVSKNELKQALIESVKKRIPKNKFGILFSGGLDSVFIAMMCKQLDADFTCYSVGLENSKDIEYAQKIAKDLDIKLKTKILDLDEIEAIAKKVTKLINPESVKVAIACVIYSALELAKKDVNVVFTGLGAEELFAGYHKYLKAEDVNKEAWQELKTAYTRDFQRDIPIAKELGMQVLTPFHDNDLTVKAMSVPAEDKIKNGYKKFILREIAEELGLKHEYAFRKKQAAQFGAKTQKALEKLTKKNNFSTISEYLNSLQ